MIVDKVYQGVVEESQRNRRRSKALTASIVSSCRRLNWYVIKGVKGKEYEVEAESILIGQEGNLHHDAVRELLSKTPGIIVSDEEFGVVGSDIYARVDVMIQINCEDCDRRENCWWFEEHGHPIGGLHNVEVKSMTDANFKIFGIRGTKAFPAHYAQCQVMLSSTPRRPLIVLAKNRLTGALEEELLPFDEEEIAKLAQIKKEFDESLQGNEPPEREYGYTSVECEGCDFRFKCWFSQIRKETAFEKDLSVGERERIRAFIKHLQGLEEEKDRYYALEGALKDYVAMLHIRHSVDKIKVPGVSSSLVRFMKEQPNLDYIRGILSEEEYDLALPEIPVIYYRTGIKLWDGK